MANPIIQQARRTYRFIPRPLLNLFIAELRKAPNDVEGALTHMRESKLYDNYYGGNKRDDGSLRMTERQYYNRQLRYNEILRDYGIPTNSTFFKSKFADLVAGGKAGDPNLQTFAEDMARVYVGVVQQAPQVRQWFQANFGNGADLTDAAIFASALDTSKSPLIYQAEINQSQIGGAALANSFSLNLQEVRRLSDHGLEQAAAQRLFSDAALQIPTYKQLAERHNDPDDDFDINDYTDALVIRDANELRTMARLLGAENSLFRSGGTFTQDDSGRLAGLSPF